MATEIPSVKIDEFNLRRMLYSIETTTKSVKRNGNGLRKRNGEGEMMRIIFYGHFHGLNDMLKGRHINRREFQLDLINESANRFYGFYTEEGGGDKISFNYFLSSFLSIN